MASMEENTVTLPNENTEEEPMAPGGRRSDNRRSVSSRYCILGKSAKLYIVSSSGNSRTSSPAVTGGRSRAGSPEDMRHSWEEEKQEQRERRRIEDGGGEDRTAY